MNRKQFVTTAVTTLIAAAAFVPFDWKISVGILAGAGGFLLYCALLESHYRRFFEGESRGILGKLLRMGVLTAVLLAAFIWPDYLSIWGVTGGFLLSKAIFLLYNTFVSK